MRDPYCVIGRAIGAGVLCAVLWGTPMFVIDTARAVLTDISRLKQQRDTPPESMIGAPFDTPYTDNAIKYAGGLGLIGGFAWGVSEVRRRKREAAANLAFRHSDRGSRNSYSGNNL